jgi:predicted esterase
MQEHHCTFENKGRYYTLGADPAEASQVWFVVHGYGQLARYFVKNFRVLEDLNIHVVAPEALSRFYLDPMRQTPHASNDRVGATWMTKENRLTDIDNYVSFLNAVFHSQPLPPDLPVTIFGFSQGTATATRWVMDGLIRFDRLILWSGIFPPDIDFRFTGNIFRGKKTFFVYGKHDPYITATRLAEMKEIAGKLGFTPDEVVFDGAHEIDQQTLLQVAQPR